MHLINFADKKFRDAQILNTKTALSKGGFENVFECNPDLIDRKFLKKYSQIFSSPTGYGYWLWKPYFIKKYLSKISNGEILIYADSGSYFIRSAKPLAELTNVYKQDIIPFSLPYMEESWTKRDAFVLMGCDNLNFRKELQRLGGFIVIKKSKFSIRFVDEYFKYCLNKNILTDIENLSQRKNYKTFVEHRHDQSVFSLLSKKYKLQAFRDPSQFGNNQINYFSNSKYCQILELTRKRRYGVVCRFFLFMFRNIECFFYKAFKK